MAAGRARVQAVALAVVKAGGNGDQCMAAVDLAVEAPEMSVAAIAKFATRPSLSSQGFPPGATSARLADRDKLPNSLDLAMADLKAGKSGGWI